VNDLRELIFEIGKSDITAHFRPKRLLSSALTCSHGIPSCGLASKSARRRASSAACSGVGSGSYPFSWMLLQTPCASSIRSLRLNFESISSFRVFHAKTPLGIGGAFQPWKPSMNSSQRLCASSTRSSNGSFFAAEKNFAKDMVSIYYMRARVQQEFLSRANSAFSIQRSAFLPP
jgi:hypothetical protein